MAKQHRFYLASQMDWHSRTFMLSFEDVLPDLNYQTKCRTLPAELWTHIGELARQTGLEPVLCSHWPVNSRLLYH